MADYTDASRFFTPDGLLRGSEAIRRFFAVGSDRGGLTEPIRVVSPFLGLVMVPCAWYLRAARTAIRRGQGRPGSVRPGSASLVSYRSAGLGVSIAVQVTAL
jgi:hypothetical protein